MARQYNIVKKGEMNSVQFGDSLASSTTLKKTAAQAGRDLSYPTLVASRKSPHGANAAAIKGKAVYFVQSK